MYRIKNLLFIIAILFYAAGLAQEEPRETVIINNDTIVIKAIPLVEISQKTEDVYNELKKIEETINSYDDQIFFKAKLEGAYDWIHKMQFLYKKIRALTN